MKKKKWVRVTLFFLLLGSLSPFNQLTAHSGELSSIEDCHMKSTLNRSNYLKKGTYSLAFNRKRNIVVQNEKELELDPIESIYNPGDTIKISGTLVKNGTIQQGESVTVTISNENEKVYEKSTLTNHQGDFVLFYRHFGPESQLGQHRIIVETQDVSVDKEFEVIIGEGKDSNRKDTPPIDPVEPKGEGQFEPPSQSVKIWGIKDNVSLMKTWTIHFNTEIERSTVNHNNIFIVDSEGEKIFSRLDLGDNGKTVKITPKYSYMKDQTYNLWILNNIRNESTTLAKSIKLEFHTK